MNKQDDWDESLHPRDEGGKFAAGGVMGGPKGLAPGDFKGTVETPTEFHARQATKFKTYAEKSGDASYLAKAALHEQAAKAANLAVKAHENGGFTYHPPTGTFPSEGYAVAIHPEHEIKFKGKEALDAKNVQDYLGARTEFFAQNPSAHLGGWYNPDDDTWYLDVSHITNDKQEAVSLGARYNQKGIYDLKEGRTIPDSEYGEVAAGDRRDSRVLRPADADAGGDRRSDARGPGGGSQGQGPAGRLVNLADKLDQLKAKRDDIDQRLASLKLARDTIRRDEWNEGDHPRAENGQFGEGSGEARPTHANPHVIETDRGSAKIFYNEPTNGWPGRWVAQVRTKHTSGTNAESFESANGFEEAKSWANEKLSKQKVSKGRGRYGNMYSGNMYSGNMYSGNMYSGNMYSGNMNRGRSDWDEDQPRDEGGRWTSGGGGGGTPDDVDRKLTGAGSSSKPTASKGPSEGLKKIASEVDKTYQDTDKKLVLRARATRLEPKEHAYLKARAEGKGGERNVKTEKSIASKLGITTQHIDEVAQDYHEHGIDKEVAESRAKWQGKAAGKLDTMAAFKKDGKWAPEREKIHDAYIESTLKGVPTTKEPTFYMTGGGPASGKTTGLLENEKASIPDKTKAAHINADEAKEFLPEYKAAKSAKDAYAASFVHEESSDTAKTGVERALKDKHDVVFDSTGDSGIDKLEQKINQYRQMGAKKVVANYAVIDVDTAIKRSDKRAERTGRFVPHAYLRANHADVARTLKGAVDRKIFDKLDVWDTTGEGTPPVHVASFTRETGLTIHNQGLWDKAVARGNDEGEE